MLLYTLFYSMLVYLGKCFSQNLTSLPMRAKIFIPSKAAVFEKFAPPAGRKGVMGGGGQDTKYS